MRGRNHIAALNELRETMESTDFQVAQHFVQGELSAKLQDPVFRYGVVMPSARTDETRALNAKINAIGNFYEGIGALVTAGLVERELVLQIWGDNVVTAWEKLAPVAAMARRGKGDVLRENFEYLTVLSQDWAGRIPRAPIPLAYVGLRSRTSGSKRTSSMLPR
jgi:hypothetical protein